MELVSVRLGSRVGIVELVGTRQESIQVQIVQRGPERGIQIPDAFFMILVDTDREYQDKPVVKLLIAYRFPQNTASDADFKNREEFGASVNDIEAATGLDFFPLFAEMFSNWEEKEGEKEMVHP